MRHVTGSASTYPMDPAQRVATRLDQGRRRVLVVVDIVQCQLDLLIVAHRGPSDEQSKDANVDDPNGIEHQDERERKAERSAEFTLTSATPLFQTRTTRPTSEGHGYMAMCRSNMLIVLQAVLTHSSISPATFRPASNPTPSKLSRLSTRQTHSWSGHNV